MKMTVIGGAGLLGSTTAFCAGAQGLFEEIYLIGRRENVLMSHVMDMDQALYPLSRTRVRKGDYAHLQQSDVIFVTASLPERAVDNRNEYLVGNLALMRGIAQRIKDNCENKVIIFATNPIDVFNYAFYEKLGWPRQYFLGFGYNDTLRLRWALADETGKPYDAFEAYVLGEHGDRQVPVFEQIFLEGEPFHTDAQTRERVLRRISTYFRSFQALDSRRTSGWTSAVSLTKILAAIARPTEEIFPCSAVLHGEYGLENVSIGVPVRLCEKGVREIVELELEEATRARLRAAAQGVRELGEMAAL